MFAVGDFQVRIFWKHITTSPSFAAGKQTMLIDQTVETALQCPLLEIESGHFHQLADRGTVRMLSDRPDDGVELVWWNLKWHDYVLMWHDLGNYDSLESYYGTVRLIVP